MIKFVFNRQINLTQIQYSIFCEDFVQTYPDSEDDNSIKSEKSVPHARERNENYE